MMNADYNTFNWTAFAAVWQAIGTVATFLAVVVALWQTKYANRKRLKLSFTDNSHVFSNNGFVAHYVCLTVSNTGNRAVIIQNWGIVQPGNKRGMVLQDVNDPLLSQIETRLPHKLEVEEGLDLAARAENFCGYLRESVERGRLNGNQKLLLFVRDSVGKEYYVRSRIAVNDMIENLTHLLK